jgi:hypothetical protein
MDEDAKNVTLLAKTKLAQDFSNFAVEIQRTITALREQVRVLPQVTHPYCNTLE